MNRWNFYGCVSLLLAFSLSGCMVKMSMKTPNSMESVRSRSFPNSLEKAHREMRWLTRLIDRQVGRRSTKAKRKVSLEKNRNFRSGDDSKTYAPPPMRRESAKMRSKNRPSPVQPTQPKAAGSAPDSVVVTQGNTYGQYRRRRRLTLCQRLCRSSQGICVASKRICRISRRFPSEPSFQVACTRANKDCSKARKRCQKCR